MGVLMEQLLRNEVLAPIYALCPRSSSDHLIRGKSQISTFLKKFPLFAIWPIAFSAPVGAQVSTHLTYDQNLRGNSNIAATGEHLFGDRVNLQDGTVTFNHEDISLPTNSQLRVSIGRKTPPRSQGLETVFPVFGKSWDLDVPYMMGTYDTRDGWNAAGSTARCSGSTFAPQERQGPWPYYHEKLIFAHMYWHGININIPGHGEEQLLRKNVAQTMPSNGATYVGTTKSSWRVRCLPTIKNATGEGFAVTLSNGLTYEFDWLATRNAIDLTDNNFVNANGDSNDDWHRLAPLTDVFLFATKVVDRFGNWVAYTYDPSIPNRISSISSNDGVRIDVQYGADGKISTISSAGRYWTYSYTNNSLSSIVLPDGSRWTFQGTLPVVGADYGLVDFWSGGCAQDPGAMRSTSPPPENPITFVVTHPSGAIGEFKYRPLYHGTNNTPGGCTLFGGMTNEGGRVGSSLYWGTFGVPSAYAVASLYQKTITGPGLSPNVWSYMYYPSWSFSSQCGGGCPTTSRTTVTTTDGVTRGYTFGNSYSLNLGQLVAETVEGQGTLLSHNAYTFLSSSAGQPFPDSTGDIQTASGNVDLYGNPIGFRNRPVVFISTTQDGATFNTSINGFDLFARPASVGKSSSLGYSKTDTIEYHDDFSKWVLGQVKRTTTDGVETTRTEFNANALPWKGYSFGKLQKTLTYYSDGTVATTIDGNSNATTLSNWNRGIPQLIHYSPTPESPSGATQSAEVHDAGWINWSKDENGHTTNYTYDPMGRLASIAYPTGDSAVWNTTTLVFAPVAAAEYGIPAGHWRQVVTSGNAKKIVYFDALWRPVVEETYDQGDVNGTLSQTVKRYDTAGQLAFQSYPLRFLSDYATVAQGTRVSYDALGRVTREEQDSELGVLTTTTEYLPGFKRKTTNPRGLVSTEGFQVFDQPSFDLPVQIDAPENTRTTIVRDVFGKPKEVTRGSGG